MIISNVVTVVTIQVHMDDIKVSFLKEGLHFFMSPILSSYATPHMCTLPLGAGLCQTLSTGVHFCSTLVDTGL